MTLKIRLKRWRKWMHGRSRAQYVLDRMRRRERAICEYGVTFDGATRYYWYNRWFRINKALRRVERLLSDGELRVWEKV